MVQNEIDLFELTDEDIETVAGGEGAGFDPYGKP